MPREKKDEKTVTMTKRQGHCIPNKDTNKQKKRSRDDHGAFGFRLRRFTTKTTQG